MTDPTGQYIYDTMFTRGGTAMYEGPYWRDDDVTVYQGDCLDVLKLLAPNSVDAVVTDPPYGLEFMGKEWDSFRTDDPGTIRHRGERAGAQGTKGSTDQRWTGADGRSIPSSRINYGGPNRPRTNRCTGCGKRDQFRNAHGCPTGTPWQSEVIDPHSAPPQMLAFQSWCQQWATECLRVLKPGGHMLAFGGTRTWHRLACAIEDAGFELRDSIAWLYGSGFPKSLDVSKAIDRDNGRKFEDRFALGRHIRERREALGLSSADVNAWFGYRDGCQHWERQDRSGARVPTLADWQVLQCKLGLSDDHLPLVERVEAEREITGTGKSGAASVAFARPESSEYNSTAPATDAARQWQGWGTALKPSWESIVHAVKPSPLAGIIDAIGSHLERLEDECKPTAKDAAKSSAHTRAGSPAEKTGSVPASAAILPAAGEEQTTATGAAADSPAPMATSASESTAETFSNTVTSWRQCWAELCDLTSTYTTATNASLTTDLRTLNSCLSQITPATITADPTHPNGSNSAVTAADNLFGACVLSLRATHALSAAENATGATPTDYPAEGGSRLDAIVVARKPLEGTVANNVQKHGVGALNVDATRVPSDDDRSRPPRTQNALYGGGNGTNLTASESNPAGRWPTNVVLDTDTAEQLDKQSGNSVSRIGTPTPRDGGRATNFAMSLGGTTGYGDSGGASRFFPTFKYTAKAPGTERPSVDGIAHATVKPVDLMRWLVRLVTPPHGLVLDPFAGSGTTGEAAIHEHMRAILIEREADYLPLIVARLHKPIQTGFDFDQEPA